MKRIREKSFSSGIDRGEEIPREEQESPTQSFNRRWIFPHQSNSTPRTLPLSPFLLSPPRNSLGSYLPLMCAALSLCVHAPKSPLIPFICTAGIRIEDRSSKRGFELSSFLPADVLSPLQCIYPLKPIDHSVPSSTFLKISPLIPLSSSIEEKLCSTFQKKKRTS